VTDDFDCGDQIEVRSRDDEAMVKVRKSARKFLLAYYGNVDKVKDRLRMFAKRRGLTISGALLPLYVAVVSKAVRFDNPDLQVDIEDVRQSEEVGQHRAMGGTARRRGFDE